MSATHHLVRLSLGVLSSFVWVACQRPGLAPPDRPSLAAPERGIVCSSAATSGGVKRVIVRGASDASVCATVRTVPGRDDEALTVRGDIEGFFATGAYADVVAVRERDEAGVDLVFELAARARMGSVSVVGSSDPAAKDAVAAVELDPPRHVDPAWLRLIQRRLEVALREAAFARSSVQSVVERGEHNDNVRFVIAEGPRALVSRVSIAGLRAAAEAPLRQQMYLRPGAPALATLVEKDKVALGVLLYDYGLLASTIETEVATSEDGARVELTFHVSEGPVHRVGKVGVEGGGQLDGRLYAPILKTLASGATVSRAEVLAVEGKLEALHADAKAPAIVQPKLHVLPGTQVVDVAFEINPR